MKPLARGALLWLAGFVHWPEGPDFHKKFTDKLIMKIHSLPWADPYTSANLSPALARASSWLWA
jgi:hypothetical protein